MSPRDRAVTRSIHSGCDRGSGSLAAIAVGAAIAAFTSLALPLYIGLAARHSIAGAADAAALAGANAASGLFSGYPCDLAATVAVANGVELVQCELDGLIVTTGVAGAVWGIRVTVIATAGPPPGVAD